MKEKMLQPLKPYVVFEPKREYFNNMGCGDQTVVYHDVKLIGDCELDLQEYFDEMEEELPQPERSYNQITLQDIVDLAPAGAKLSEIKLDISYPRMAEYLEVKFLYYKRDLEKEENLYQAALEKYKHEHAQYLRQCEKYEKRMAEYREWKKQQEIEELEEKLAKLKK